MASTHVANANKVTDFKKEVLKAYVRGGMFGSYTGKSQNAVIQLNRNLKELSIPLVSSLGGDGVSGNSTLVGNEEVLSNYAYKIDPTHYRNGVLISDEEDEKSEFSLYQEARPALQNWMMELKRDQIIQAMGAVQDGSTYVDYGSASATNLDNWQAANTDRILYGAAKSNLTAGNHTTSLGTIDTSADRLTASRVSLLKRMAESADPLIRPIMVNDDNPMFVFFVDSYGHRDLFNDSTIQQANREARNRGLDNPIFTGADLVYDNVIIKKIPDIDKFIDGGSNVPSAFNGVFGANATSGDGLDDGGNSSTRVGVGFFCGAQAVGMVVGKEPSFSLRKEDDYGFQKGVGMICKHGIKKTFFNGKQHGMITHFYSAPLDA